MKNKQLVGLALDALGFIVCVYIISSLIDDPFSRPLSVELFITISILFGALWFGGRMIIRIVFWRWW